MSSTVVGLLGFLTIVAIVVTLFKSKTIPAIAFIVFPMLLALVLVIGGYYSFGQVGSLIKSGYTSTAPTAALFLFSVLYFGIMTDAGMFDVIIGKLMKLVGDNVIGVALITCLIAMVGHLDGGGASTFLIVVPAMLPVFKRMHMRPVKLLQIAVLAMGVMNLMPWAGPTMRAATVLGIDPGELWRTLLPIQVFGIVLAFAHALYVGITEKNYIAKHQGDAEFQDVEIAETEKKENEWARPKLFAFNVILTLCVIAMLIWGEFPDYVPFMIGVSCAILVNYPDLKLQKKVINSHAGPAITMSSTLMAAGVLMGILVKTVSVDGVVIDSVVTCMSGIISSILPDVLGMHLPLVIGVLSVPLALAFDTDSYFYGMLPVMIGIGAGFGIEALGIAVAMVICRNCATFISPMVPATLLGVGLAEVEIKDHIKNAFIPVWIFSILCMIFGVILGIIPF